MSDPNETIARRLAARFAPALGTELAAITERLLADEPDDERPLRAGDPGALVACAAFIVAVSSLAWSAYLRLTHQREVAALQSEVSVLKGMLIAELLREAPHDRRIAEPTRRLLVSATAELTFAEAAGTQQRATPIVPERAGPLLRRDEIMEIHRAIISARLTNSRAALLTGIDASFIASLPSAESPGEQVLCDLGELNAVRSLADRSVPLAIWLENAGALAGARKEAAVFHIACARVDEVDKS